MLRGVFSRRHIMLLVLSLLCGAVSVQAADIPVPTGMPVAIDGTLFPNEWDAAIRLPMEPDGTLLLMADPSFLYLAVQAGAEPVTNVYVLLEGSVHVLHASAALGSAIFKRDGDQWIQTNSYLPYACRSTRPSEESSYALWERTTFFENEGWFASNVFMGAPSDLEFQIPWSDGVLSLAAICMFAAPPTLRLWLPQALADDCWNQTLLYAEDVSPLQFEPETWLTLIRASDVD